jgi:hypothetical protein
VVLWGGERSGTDLDNSFFRRLDEGHAWMFCASRMHFRQIKPGLRARPRTKTYLQAR